MGRLVYSMSVSLDGFIAGPDGDFAWSVPDEEQHRFHNEEMRGTGTQLCGRRLYETMGYWETDEPVGPSSSEVEREFAEVWRATPKVVFSTTLERVGPNARLVQGDAVAEIRRLKEEASEDLGVGGAGLASACIAHGLVDEYRVFVCPVIAGGGTPFFPPLERLIDLELVETRRFGSRVTYLRYRAV